MARIAEEYARKDKFLRRWSAVIILLVFFFLSWIGQFTNQLEEVKQKSQQHGQEFHMSEFWPQFWSSTFENWQSEWLQLATQAILISALAEYFFRKGSEDQYKTHLMIEELQNELKNK